MTKKKVRKKKLKTPAKVFIVFAILLISGGILLQVSNFSFDKKPEPPKKKEIEQKETKKEMNANLVMVGDALIHSAVYADAKNADGTYDFKPMLEHVKPIIGSYDLAYYNQETILGGTQLGLSNYPRFNSPYEVGDAFIDAGFDLVSLATNHTMDKGEQGVLNSNAYWRERKDIYTAGSYASFEDRDKAVIKEVNGIKYAFLSYTTWTNGLTPPPGKEYLDNIYSPELAAADIKRVRDKVDVVIVAMHWGTEYSFDVSPAQTEIASYLSDLGVDIIVGAHPHVVEPIEYIGKTLVIYSLGNFISDQDATDRLTGLMVSVDIKKVVDKDITTISVEKPKVEFVYTKSNVGGKRNFKLYPYSKLNSTILPTYKTLYEKYKGIVGSRLPSLEFVPLSGE